MFVIRFRVTEGLDEMRTASLDTLNQEFFNLDGFFQIQAGKQTKGYYHDGPVQDWECETEIINSWFSRLLEMVKFLDREDGCVLVESIDDNGIWIAFDKRHDKVKVSCIRYHNYKGFIHYCTGTENVKETFWSVPDLEWVQTRNEVINKAKKLIEEMEDLNPLILKSSALCYVVELMKAFA